MFTVEYLMKIRVYITEALGPYMRDFYYENGSLNVPCLKFQQWLQRAHMLKRDV